MLKAIGYNDDMEIIGTWYAQNPTDGVVRLLECLASTMCNSYWESYAYAEIIDANLGVETVLYMYTVEMDFARGFPYILRECTPTTKKVECYSARAMKEGNRHKLITLKVV